MSEQNNDLQPEPRLMKHLKGLKYEGPKLKKVAPGHISDNEEEAQLNIELARFTSKLYEHFDLLDEDSEKYKALKDKWGYLIDFDLVANKPKPESKFVKPNAMKPPKPTGYNGD